MSSYYLIYRNHDSHHMNNNSESAAGFVDFAGRKEFYLFSSSPFVYLHVYPLLYRM